MRAACAVGSGAQSIGLDPRTNQLRPFFPELVDLMRCVTKSVREKTCWKNAHFNFVSVKQHCTFYNENGKRVEKDAKWHVHVALNKNGVPMANNSQLPLSPVAILTHGDSKSLFFVRHRSSGKTDFEANTLFEAPQEMGSIFLLDGRDELLDELNQVWRHCSGPSGGALFLSCFGMSRKQVRHCAAREFPPMSTCLKRVEGCSRKRRNFTTRNTTRNNVCTLAKL